MDVAPYRRANISKMFPTTSRKNSWKNLVDDLTQILHKVKPKIIVMPHPWLDSHLDHEYTSVALVQAMEQWKDNAGISCCTQIMLRKIDIHMVQPER